MTYQERLAKFQAALAQVALPAHVCDFQFNDGTSHDYHILASLDMAHQTNKHWWWTGKPLDATTPNLPDLRAIARQIQKTLRQIPGVREVSTTPPKRQYKYYDQFEPRVLQGYDVYWINVHLVYVPDEEAVSLEQLRGK
jgi:hypothetical protein